VWTNVGNFHVGDEFAGVGFLWELQCLSFGTVSKCNNILIVCLSGSVLNNILHSQPKQLAQPRVMALFTL